MRRPLPRRAGALLLIAAGGCANRGASSHPEHAPSSAAWALIVIAVVLAGSVLGAVLLGPPDHRPRFASIVLTVNAGIVAVGLAVLVGVILRSAHLAQQRADGADPAGHSLLRITSIDGDPTFFRTVLLFTGVVGGLTLLLLVIGARFAAGDDPAERGAACAVLAVGLVGALLCVGLLARGSRWWPVVIGAVELPFLVAGLVSCWPSSRAEQEAVPSGDSGYNGQHG